jgi:glycosyltransferase involved in cell wall biosynthesis
MIVIDDCSTDRTPDIIKKINSKKIKYVKLPRNQGTGNALQIALKMIDTPYFVIVDSDDWIESQTLEVLLKEMEKQPPTTSMAYGNTVIWFRKSGRLQRRTERHRSFRDKYDFFKYRAMMYPRFFRTETVRRVKGFETDDPFQGRYAEDRYLLLKLIGIGNFHWVNQNLYNLRRDNNDNVTSGKNREKFVKVLRYIYTKVLKQWGDEYEPVFEVNRYGWLILKELKKNGGEEPHVQGKGHGSNTSL